MLILAVYANTHRVFAMVEGIAELLFRFKQKMGLGNGTWSEKRGLGIGTWPKRDNLRLHIPILATYRSTSPLPDM